MKQCLYLVFFFCFLLQTSELFALDRRDVEGLYNQNKIQEAMWLASDLGIVELETAYHNELKSLLNSEECYFEKPVSMPKNKSKDGFNLKGMVQCGKIKAIFKPGNKCTSGTFRSAYFASVQGGDFGACADSEVATSLLGNLLNFRVPMTIKRKVKGYDQEGSLQVWVGSLNVKEAFGGVTDIPDEIIAHPSMAETRVFDFLVGMDDRTEKNMLWFSANSTDPLGPDAYGVLIDHGLALRFTQDLGCVHNNEFYYGLSRKGPCYKYQRSGLSPEQWFRISWSGLLPSGIGLEWIYNVSEKIDLSHLRNKTRINLKETPFTVIEKSLQTLISPEVMEALRARYSKYPIISSIIQDV